jgi:tripartite-type tricarboxylate transporter receptor subunit TctC
VKRLGLFILMVSAVISLVFAGCSAPAPSPASSPEASSGPVSTQKAAEFYKGKTVTLYVPSTPGSGLDNVARVIQPLMQQELGATIVVENKPGGGYTIPINQLYDKPDIEGLSISMIEGASTVSSQLLALENCRYDLRKMNIICNISAGDGICVVAPDSPYQSMGDLLSAKKLVASATGPTTPTGMAAKVILELALKLPVKVVTGYDAAPATYKAIVQKEADVCLGLYSAASGLIAANQLKVLFVWQPERMGYLPNVPTVYEALTKEGKLTPDVKNWIDVIININSISRGLLVSPGVPADRVQYLRETMNRILKSQSLADSLNKLQIALYPLTGQQTMDKMNQVLNMEPAKAQELKKLLVPN